MVGFSRFPRGTSFVGESKIPIKSAYKLYEVGWERLSLSLYVLIHKTASSEGGWKCKRLKPKNSAEEDIKASIG